jgi:hypothetical protein
MTTKGSVSAVYEGHGTTQQIDIDGYWAEAEDVLRNKGRRRLEQH